MSTELDDAVSDSVSDAAGDAVSDTGRGRSAKGLTRELIVEAAVRFADEHGVAAMSMRKLAAELDCEAMSLYHHLPSKAALLDAAVDAVAAEVELPAADAEWRAGVHAVADSIFRTLLRHPWAIELWTKQFPLQHRLTVIEVLLDLLARADLDEHLADTAFHAVHLHVVGFAQQATAYEASMANDDNERRFEAEVSADDYPRLVAHKHYHDAVDAGELDRPDTFTFVLDLILDGLERTGRPQP